MKTDLKAIFQFMGKLHQCAVQMQLNGAFIRKELPSLRMTEPLRVQIDQFCDEMIGTGFDLVHDMIEIQEMIVEKDLNDTQIISRVRVRAQWVDEIHILLKAAVDAARAAHQAGEADSLLVMLLMESGVNVLTASPPMPDFL